MKRLFKKAVCTFLSIIVCISLFIKTEYKANSISLTPPSLSGTVYTVSTASHLRWIAGVCNGTIDKGTQNYPSDSSFAGYTILLKNNITLGSLAEYDNEYILAGGEEWIPIGTESAPFSGIFDGNECSVSGVYINNSLEYSGFFGVVSNGVINNLTVKGYVSGKKSVGGIVGTLNGKISGCIFSGRVDGGENVGGIVGEIQGSEKVFSELYLNVAACEIRGENSGSIGGIAGKASYANIKSCSCGIELISSSAYVGGVLGSVSTDITIDCCDVTGVLINDGTSSCLGGILGKGFATTEIKNCTFDGSLYSSAERFSYCGGIAGELSGKIENSFVVGDIHSALYFEDISDSDLSGDIFSSTDDVSNPSDESLWSEESSMISDESLLIEESSLEEEISSALDTGGTSEQTEKVSVSGGIIAKTSTASINNCYFAGMSECNGVEGFEICNSEESVEVKNTFYSLGIAYYLYGSDDIYHVTALHEALGTWVKNAGGGYSTWQLILGINKTRPVLKHSSAAGSDGDNAWKVEGTTFTFYTYGEMEDFSPNQYSIVNTPWNMYSLTVKTIKIKEGVTSIGDYAFYGFEKVTKLYLPETLERIGDYSFEHCSALGNFTIPSGVNDIGEGAFRACKNIKNIVLPRGIRAVRDYTFSNCGKLASVTIPDTVSLVGHKAFALCDSLTVVTLPQSVREIDSYAFYWCDALNTVTLPENLNRIGEYAFGRCDSLINYNIPKKTIVEKNAFWSTLSKGDVDGDGTYTVFDYIKIKAHFLGIKSLSNEEIKAADSNFDGIVTTTDYLYVKACLRGK